MMIAYFDDSGTHRGATHTVLGGLIGTEEQWEFFNEAWRQLLKQPFPDKPALKNFHLSHCKAGEGEFSSYNQAERDRIQYLFRHIILDAGLISMASAIDNAAWDELIIGEIRDGLGEPNEYAFVKCIDFAIDFGRSCFPIQSVKIFIDSGWKSDAVRTFAGFYLAQPQKYPTLLAIDFVPVIDTLGLQGADMIATETYWYSQEWARNGPDRVPRAHFNDFVYRELSRGMILERDAIEEVVKRYREANDPNRFKPPSPYVVKLSFKGQ
jgi:hypothetical protein